MTDFFEKRVPGRSVICPKMSSLPFFFGTTLQGEDCFLSEKEPYPFNYFTPFSLYSFPGELWKIYSKRMQQENARDAYGASF